MTQVSVSPRYHIYALTSALVCTLCFFGFLGTFTTSKTHTSASGTLSTASIAVVELHHAAIARPSSQRLPQPVAPPQPPLQAELAGAVDSIPQLTFVAPPTMPNAELWPSLAGAPFSGLAGSHLPPAGNAFLAPDIIALDRAQPNYPMDAAEAKVAGFVRIEFVVQADGRVRDAIVIEAEPKGSFEAAALAAVLTWRFKPRVIRGRAVVWRASQRITFTPRRGAIERS